MSLPWFRMWAEAVDDAKLRVLSYDDRWHFVALLCLKAQGILDERDQELRLQMICTKFGMDSAELEKTMKRLVTVGLVSPTWQPLKWNHRQFRSDSSTNRVRAFRERFRNVSETDQIQKQRQIQIQKEEVERTPRAPTAKRLPPDFSLTEERKVYAKAQKVDPEREFENFTDYWLSASGAKARKHDWDRAWRMWCRKASDMLPGGRPATSEDDFNSRIKWRPTDEESGDC